MARFLRFTQDRLFGPQILQDQYGSTSSVLRRRSGFQHHLGRDMGVQHEAEHPRSIGPREMLAPPVRGCPEPLSEGVGLPAENPG